MWFKAKRYKSSLKLWRIAGFLLLTPAALLAGLASSSITLVSSGSPSAYGHAVTLNATVSPPAVSGKVNFYDGTTILGTRTLTGGVATFSTSLLESGVRSLKALYLGDSTYASSRSTALSQTVNAVAESQFLPPLNFLGNPPICMPGFCFPSAIPGTVTPFGAGLNEVADFNGDGIPDIVTINSIYPGSESFYNGTAETPADLPSPFGSAIQILLGNGDGTFRYGPINFNVYALVYGAVNADFNLDGNTDILTFDPIGGDIAVLLGNGDGTFYSPNLLYQYVTSNAGGTPGFAVADFNGDGIPDLIVAGTTTVFTGKGDGTFSVSLINATPAPGVPVASTFVTSFDGTAVEPVVAADFNGDGKADIATNQGTSTVVCLGNGDTTFQTCVPVPGGIGSQFLATADFNGDGKADLASLVVTPSVPESAGVLYVWLGKGDGTFQDPVSFPGGNTNLTAEDFNGDGKPDLITMDYEANPNASSPAILLNLGNGDGTFQPFTPFDLTASSGITQVNYASGVAVADFNGDGRTDFAFNSVSGGGTNQISVLLGAGSSGSVIPTTTVLTSSPNPSFGGAATGNDLVTLTASVSPSLVTGTVTFYEGSTILGTATLNGGTAVLPIATLSAGTHSLNAAYEGDTTHSVSVSNVIEEQIMPLTVPSSEPAPNPISPNLLINPGAENGMSGWSTTNSESGSAPGPAHSGTQAFDGVANQDAFISQTIGLSTISEITLAEIDSGALTVNYSFWGSNPLPNGYTAVTLTFIDGSGNKIGQGRSAALTNGALAWYNSVGSMPIPSGARSIVYTMDFWGGGGDIGVIDDNVLTISRNALTPNLLTNPGAEMFGTGWYASYGVYPAISAASYFGAVGGESSNLAHSGIYIFCGCATPSNYLTQTVSLINVVSLDDIDAGLLTANYSFWYADQNGNTGSMGRITLTFRDDNGNHIGQSLPPVVFGTVVNHGGVIEVPWIYETGTFPIPPGTRSINYTMDFNGTSTQNSGAIDDNILTISRQ